jgi:hypothetical protein
MIKTIKEWKPKGVDSDPLSFSTEVVDSVVGSPKDILFESDVVPDVSTSLVQPGQYRV